MKITLYNDFHNTKTFVLTKETYGGSYPYHFISARQMKEAGKRLCGIKGCTCGDSYRGWKNDRNVQIQQNGSVIKYFSIF
jgi:hypothetical protein